MKTALTTTALITTVVAAGLAGSSHAAILADFQFTGGSSEDSAGNSDVTVPNFAFTDTVSEVGDADVGFSGGGQAFVRSIPTGINETEALADDDTLLFTVTAANPGEVLNLSSLNVSAGGSSGVGGTVFDTTVYVQSSVDGATPIATNTHTVSTFSTTFDAVAIDLTGSQYQGISTITFTFRFSTPSEDQTPATIHRLDSVVLNGDVGPVPEPGSLALVGVLGIIMLRRRPPLGGINPRHDTSVLKM